ncbi:3-keto-5-aminohexanoate cleavage protein [Bradyrhizobium sp. 23]|jgi:uncharacterized protein (DUF849 family)|uniref:3-keto-5-aminohexanoate cleavage protein n=1 Tax=Bradyrhizobium sp. 23 TaxID=2782667 RepID=UPI001FFB7E7A|nr:3-keto-5-aminohexanoate cleavage protein [Bradyrhizobium sp. 23]MCK1315459.1 3-keto-5-aminohexanoate cleavage protein [Bradyrhizobium sp. 23]
MAAQQSKVIITCAITGSIHTPSMTPYLPITPAQIASSAIEAAKAGAAILHLHAREPANGRPSADVALFREFLPEIKAKCDAIINITTGGAPTMTVQERLEGPRSLSPEMASLNLGSMNFGLFPIAEKRQEFKYHWEKSYLAGTKAGIFKNTFEDIETIIKTLGEGHGTRFEYECYDIGHLYTLAHFVDKGLAKPPLFVQSIFGILGGIGADLENLLAARQIAEKLFGNDYRWSVLAAGKNQMSFSTVSAIAGGNVRVGLEDSVYLGKGQLAQSNAEQVTKIARILRDLGLELASPDEARAMLHTKGANQVAF